MRPRLSWKRLAVGIGLLLIVIPVCLEGAHLVHNTAYRGVAPICRVQTSQKAIGFSFDDGPSPQYTSQVLRLLSRYGDRATFFVLGQSASRWGSLVQAELSKGMEVGDHTWDHPNLTQMDTAETIAEVTRTRIELEGLGATVALFRAPYGYASASELRAIESAGLQPIHWSLALDHYVGGLDYSPTDAANMIASNVGAGDIVLAHDAPILPNDGGGFRAEAMQTLTLLLPLLKNEGYRVVPVGQLLQLGEPVYAVPRPWFWESGFTCP